MKMDVWMGVEPRVISFMDAVVVQDNVDLLFLRNIGHYLIHELQELDSPLLHGGLRTDGSGRYFQRSEKV